MLKLAVDESSSQGEDAGSATVCPSSWTEEQPQFLSFLLDRHPNIDCVALHTSSRAGVKPTKDDSYTIIHGQAYVLEETPNGVPFALSPDTFCEVNHEMEGHVFQAIARYCPAPTSTSAHDCLCKSSSSAFTDAQHLHVLPRSFTRCCCAVGPRWPLRGSTRTWAWSRACSRWAATPTRSLSD